MTLSQCRTLHSVIQIQKCVSMLNQIDVFLSALQKYLNQKSKTSNQQGKAFQLLGPATAKDLQPQSVR